MKDETEIIEELLSAVQTKFKKGELKPTLGDYIRLMQLRRELEENEPKNIEVKWVDPEKAGGENDE